MCPSRSIVLAACALAACGGAAASGPGVAAAARDPRGVELREEMAREASRLHGIILSPAGCGDGAMRHVSGDEARELVALVGSAPR